MTRAGVRRAVLVALPCVDVMTEIGLASAFPQLRAAYGSVLHASVVVSAGPLFAVLTGWIWGALARRLWMKRSVALAMSGWAVVTAGLGMSIDVFMGALILRALQGIFAAGLAALPFIALSRESNSARDRARGMGVLEVSISAGAIAAPISVGTLLAVAPGFVLPALGFVTVGLLALWLAAGGDAAGARVSAVNEAVADAGVPVTAGREHAGQPWSLRLARWVMLPTFFASGIALILSASESLIPTVAEALFDSVVIGKTLTMAFELAVVCGIVLKARRPGVRYGVPLLLSVLIAASFLMGWYGSAGPAIWLMVIAGFPVGAGVTMGNEYAASNLVGFEEVGMGLYSTLRISGSFLGPLVLNVAYPGVLLVLAAVSLGCACLVLPQRHRLHSANCRHRRA